MNVIPEKTTMEVLTVKQTLSSQLKICKNLLTKYVASQLSISKILQGETKVPLDIHFNIFFFKIFTQFCINIFFLSPVSCKKQ